MKNAPTSPSKARRGSVAASATTLGLTDTPAPAPAGSPPAELLRPVGLALPLNEAEVVKLAAAELEAEAAELPVCTSNGDGELDGELEGELVGVALALGSKKVTFVPLRLGLSRSKTEMAFSNNLVHLLPVRTAGPSGRPNGL